MYQFRPEPGPRFGFAKDSDLETPGWVSAGIGFEGERLDVGGVNPWLGTPWISLHQWIVASHPAYRRQRHRADIYQLRGPAGSPVTFAAAELSNGVWGFYVPDAVGDEPKRS
jgi:hypothetical protein